MAVIKLHHYQGCKKPFVARIAVDARAPSETRLVFLSKQVMRVAKDGSFGDYAVTVKEDGLYYIGNAQDNQNGYRLRFVNTQGQECFPFVRDAQVLRAIKQRIIGGAPVADIAASIGFQGLDETTTARLSRLR